MKIFLIICTFCYLSYAELTLESAVGFFKGVERKYLYGAGTTEKLLALRDIFNNKELIPKNGVVHVIGYGENYAEWLILSGLRPDVSVYIFELDFYDSDKKSSQVIFAGDVTKPKESNIPKADFFIAMNPVPANWGAYVKNGKRGALGWIRSEDENALRRFYGDSVSFKFLDDGPLAKIFETDLNNCRGIFQGMVRMQPSPWGIFQVN